MKRTVMLAALIAIAVISASGMAYSAPRDAEKSAANLKVTKATPDRDVSVGEDFTWTVRVKNRGESRAANVRLVDRLPVLVRLFNILPSQGGPCRVDFPRVICTLDTIGGGETAVVKFRVDATQAGVLKNRARATTTSPETQLQNNRAVSVVRAS